MSHSDMVNTQLGPSLIAHGPSSMKSGIREPAHITGYTSTSHSVQIHLLVTKHKMVFEQLVDVSFDHLKHIEDLRSSRLMIASSAFENQHKTKTETDASVLWWLFKLKHYK